MICWIKRLGLGTKISRDNWTNPKSSFYETQYSIQRITLNAHSGQRREVTLIAKTRETNKIKNQQLSSVNPAKINTIAAIKKKCN